MLVERTLPQPETTETALNQAQLYALGREYAQRLAHRVWSDYNVHDPGVTTLELLCYALSDLAYRASFPIKDLLVSEGGGEISSTLFTARQILPNRPLTLLDYRKLLIDLKGVKNAWLQPALQTYYADTVRGQLQSTGSDQAGMVEVRLSGLYDVTLEYEDAVQDGAKPIILQNARERLQANRNLCEDFVGFAEVEPAPFLLCGELMLSPDADVSRVKAEILFTVQRYLSPPVVNHTLLEMLEQTKSDGSRYTVDEIFNGPALDCGFIGDEEVAQADLRTEISLADIISRIMHIQGVQAVREMIINPEGTASPLKNKWVVPVTSGKKAVLNRTQSRLVFYKDALPVVSDDVQVEAYYQEWTDAATAKSDEKVSYDLNIPAGQYRSPGRYDSFQNHFPAVYGISAAGLDSAADETRKALARQWKGYLLFYDQIMANYLAQLEHVKELFSTDPALMRTYFYQTVDSFPDYKNIYGPDVNPAAVLQNEVEEKGVSVERRNRFLDHLIARFAERFHDFVHIMYSAFGSSPESMVRYKCDFLNRYPVISSERLLAYNYTLQAESDRWNTENVSGLEKRLAALLGIRNETRRGLGSDEGMYLIENILLRPEHEGDPFLPICPEPYCEDCADADPYSYRVHIVLPAYSGRFLNPDFRYFAEKVIRQETPAHILPKICWASQEDMVVLEKTYYDWLALKAGIHTDTRRETLEAFIKVLFAVKSVYPSGKLHACESQEERFLLGRTALGTLESPQSESTDI